MKIPTERPFRYAGTHIITEKNLSDILHTLFNSIHTFISDIKSPYTIKYTYKLIKCI